MQTRIDTILKNKDRQLHSVPPQSTVIDAVHVMNRARIGALLVIDEGRLVGIFTERDVLARVIEKSLDPQTTTVRDVMTERVVAVQVDRTSDEAMAIMTERRCRHLPVFDGESLIGVVSIGDLTRWNVRDKSFLIDQLVNYVTDRYPG